MLQAPPISRIVQVHELHPSPVPHLRGSAPDRISGSVGGFFIIGATHWPWGRPARAGQIHDTTSPFISRSRPTNQPLQVKT